MNAHASGPGRPPGRRSTRRRILRLGAVTILTAVLVGAALAAWSRWPRSPAPDSRFLDRKGGLTGVAVLDRVVRGGMLTEDLTLTSDSGLSIRCLVQSPAAAQGRLPAVVLMGGIESGRLGLLRLPTDRYPLVWLSLDYPYELPRGIAGPGDARRELRRAVKGAEDTVAGILLARDYLETRADVDPGRVVAGGGSLGAFVTVIAAAVDERFGAVVLLYGGGDVARIIENNLAWKSGIGKRLAVEALNPWLAPLEPSRHVGRIAPRPLLMVNGTGDRMFPRACVDALYEAAGEPKELIWLETGHRIIDQPELMARALEAAMSWLRETGFLDEDGS